MEGLDIFTDTMTTFCYSLESSTQCASNESILIPFSYYILFRFHHQLKQVMFTEKDYFGIKTGYFHSHTNFRSLYKKNCPSANTYRKIAFCYFLESLAQCASNEFNFIALRHSVQVLSSDERGHVYRNKANSASNFNFSDYFNFHKAYI